MEKTENYLKQILHIFYANKKLIYSIAILFSLLTVITAFLYPPVYVMTGSFIVKSKKIQLPPEISQESMNSRMILPPTREDILSETKIILSEKLIQNSLEDLISKGVALSEEPNEIKIFIKEHFIEPVKKILIKIGVMEPGNELSEIEILKPKILTSLTTRVIPGSNIIEVGLLYDNAVIGTQILNGIFDNYLTFRRILFTNEGANSFYSGQLAEYRERLDVFEREKLKLLEQISTADIEKEVLANTELIETLRKELAGLEDSIFEKQRTLDFLNKLLEQHLNKKESDRLPFPYDFEDREIQQYNDKLSSLNFEHSDAIRVFKKDSEKIRNLNKQINELRTKLVYLIRNKIILKEYEKESIEVTIIRKKEKLDSMIAENQILNESKSKLERLDFDINLHKNNYESFFKKAEESKIEKASQISQLANVQILARAIEPLEPYFPNKKLVIPIGVAVGILLGFSMGFIKEFFDHTFKTPDQVNRYLELPMIGTILYKDSWTTKNDKNNRIPIHKNEAHIFPVFSKTIPTDSTYVALRKGQK